MSKRLDVIILINQSEEGVSGALFKFLVQRIHNRIES